MAEGLEPGQEGPQWPEEWDVGDVPEDEEPSGNHTDDTGENDVSRSPRKTVNCSIHVVPFINCCWVGHGSEMSSLRWHDPDQVRRSKPCGFLSVPFGTPVYEGESSA